MEELLPLIIGILWLVYTFYTKGQKKKSAERTPAGRKAADKPSFLEQLLAGEGIQLESPEPEYDDETYHYEPIDEPEPVASREEIGKSSPFLNMELSGYVEEGQSQFKEAFAIDEKEEFIHDEIEDVEVYNLRSELSLEMHDFDLRKAVVFSAILEAPYIDYK